MPVFNIHLEKKYSVSGYYEIAAKSTTEALKKANKLITQNRLQSLSPKIQWNDLQYEDQSFGIAGCEKL